MDFESQLRDDAVNRNDLFDDELPSSLADICSNDPIPSTLPSSLIGTQTQDPPIDPSQDSHSNVSDGNTCIDILRQLCRTIQTECTFPELLPTWTESHSEIEREKVRKLIMAWSETQEQQARSKPPVSLNAVDRLASRINEATQQRLTRCMQIYYLTRLRKVLFDPVSVLELQATNPDIKLIEQRELKIAEAWESYICDHGLNFAAASFTCLHVQVNQDLLNKEAPEHQRRKALEVIDQYIAYGQPHAERLSDPMYNLITSALEAETETLTTPKPPPIMCLMCERFRQGFYSNKLQTRL
eukprot:Blabericola_migrator_1__6637@NODE_334_length_9665_cov_140_658158_g270_i0_p4_GENE_NODE_334_length_9665_cov_140_658158_g270_i0NODE_334_length_9665_cov_140_658158_g270_i0_p4_ORF_typecomplete_len299_score77_29RGS/PF00615_19/0_18CTD_bind/PF04818_13/40CTD_bind/PF04818_13/5_7e02CTD_bind/PF04818_13/6_1e02_NODE_334_length_9665_cov_140_658158_g270_i015382434